MPQINLSTLSGPELRQMLDSSRRQGDASLSYKVLQEMAARRAAAPQRNGKRRRGDEEPRALVVDLEPPQDDLPPMPNWRPPARPGDEQPLTLDAPEPAAEERRSWRKARGKAAKTSLAQAVAAHPDPAPAPAEDEPARPDHATGEQAQFRSLDLDLADDGFEPAVPEALPRFHDTALNGSAFDAPEPEPHVAAASEEDVDLRMGPAAPEPAPPPVRKPPRRRSPRAPLGFAIGLALGAALGWWVAVYREAPQPVPIQTAAAATPPAAVAPPAAQAAPAGEPATAPVDGALTPGATEAASPPASSAAAPPAASSPLNALPPAAPPAAVAPPSPPPAAAPATVPAPRSAEPADADQAAAGVAAEKPVARAGCAAEATPADRVICGDPDLKRLQKDLQRAYAQALAAHEDRSTLRARQLAWRDSRSAVTDPAKLAALYRERIHKLEGATAEAKRQHGPPEAPH